MGKKKRKKQKKKKQNQSPHESKSTNPDTKSAGSESGECGIFDQFNKELGFVESNRCLPTPEEQKLLKALQTELTDAVKSVASSPELTSQHKLLRFLRGYQGDVKAAATAYQSMTEFVLENKVLDMYDHMKRLEAQSEQKMMPLPYTMEEFAPIVELVGNGLMKICGDDNNGDLVTSVWVGDYDLRPVVKAGKDMEDLLLRGQMYLDVYLDILAHRRTIAKGGVLAQRNDMVNVSTLSLFQFTPSCLSLMKRITTNTKHFPEATSRITSCGNGYIGVKAWSWVKGWVAEQTRRKIQVVGMDWLPVLTQRISMDVIPVSYGGRNEV